MTTEYLDEAKSQQFSEKMVGIINGAAIASGRSTSRS